MHEDIIDTWTKKISNMNRLRTSSVSFIRSRKESSTEEYVTEFNTDDEDDIQITLAPYVQSYLAYSFKRLNCCGITLPIPFERASRSSWWNPRYDSEILEDQYKRSALTQLMFRFRYALFYLLILLISWLMYFEYCELIYNTHSGLVQRFIAVLIVIVILMLAFTYTETYSRHITATSLVVAFTMCTVSLFYVIFVPVSNDRGIESNSNNSIYLTNISPVGQMATCIEILLLIYTIIPLPLYICATLTLTYSVFFEMLVNLLHNNYYYSFPTVLIVRTIIHVCVHLIGIHIYIMTNVRMRGTFMKVGQSLLVRRQLEMEKQLKEKMIHSVMPPKVATWLMNETGEFDIGDPTKTFVPRTSNSGASDLKSMFRPFNMNTMENVSILFADIVGFTRMSSNKTAEGLVEILNDLFERFDDLCSSNHCEKISTLGDCYYCVSGCPEPRSDHAICCVEMGLGMIEAIKVFDEERNEGVNMRVGIHTGTVLCGIVGTRRFKFDVWSNDVTLANKMESTGKPGQVHISQKTADFLDELYVLEEGENVDDINTYFIVGRQYEINTTNSKLALPNCAEAKIKLIISNTDSLTNLDRTISPRLSKHKLSLNTPSPPNPYQLFPIFRTKANSLPSVLDSDAENPNPAGVNDVNDNSRSPTSVASYSKYSSRLKSWKVPKFLLKRDGSDTIIDVDKLDGNRHSNGYQQIPTSVKNECETRKKSVLQMGDQNASVGDKKDQRSCAYDKNNDILDIKSYISQSRSDVGHFDRSPGTSFRRTGSYNTRQQLSICNNAPTLITPNNVSGKGFSRTSSAKSQHGKSGSVKKDLSPVGRVRSATVAARLETNCLEIPGAQVNDDHLSGQISLSSRKDSGIRSNSRRSSIQQQIFAMNQSQLDIFNQRRVSGYYTSSQSTINSELNKIQPPEQIFGVNIQKLRKQSDLQLIRCVQDNTSSKRSYFIEPPISPVTLCFKTRQMEKEYRKNISITEKWNEKSVPTLATPRYNTLLDVTVGTIFFLLISLSLFLLFIPTKLFIYSFFLLLFIHMLVIYLCYRQIVKFSLDSHIFQYLSNWYFCHVVGAVFVSTPIVVLLINFSCYNVNIKVNDYLYIYLFLVALVHFANFTQLNFWLKNALGTVFSVMLVIFIKYECERNGVELIELNANVSYGLPKVHLPLLSEFEVRSDLIVEKLDSHAYNLTSKNELFRRNAGDILRNNLSDSNILDDSHDETFTNKRVILNNAHIPELTTYYLNKNNLNNAFDVDSNNLINPNKSKRNILNNLTHTVHSNNSNTFETTNFTHLKNADQFYFYTIQIYTDIFLLLLLVWFLNREFEISYRLSFHSNSVANRDKMRVQNMKNQADWLLHNIIPQHVADQLKNTAKYSENHKDVGVIFARIVNFNELYDESFMGGKEFLRVLNELIGDFDELLVREEFKNVEKIKTIGSTFMAASGLNPNLRKDYTHQYQHLFDLMDFAMELQKVIDNFNRDLIEFNLVLRVGYNYGDVTAGVIGTSKLYYDIWGDAVNIASRMDTTGVDGRVQIAGNCLNVLQERYEFEPRGSVYVKGKDNMNVYLLTRKKDCYC